MNKELEFMLDVIGQAEKISEEAFTVSEKAGGVGNDLITNLDIKIEEFLISKIKENYPTFDIVSEETNSKKSVTENCFIFDPIDGTINFANGLTEWAIQIACVKNGETVGSVISMPRRHELYWADSTGAYLNGKKISVKQVPLKNTLWVVDGNKVFDCMTRMSKYSHGCRRFGAVAVSMAFVACGRVHGAVFRSDKAWDYFAGLYLIKQAGGVVADEKGFHAGASNTELLEILRKETAKREDE